MKFKKMVLCLLAATFAFSCGGCAKDGMTLFDFDPKEVKSEEDYNEMIEKLMETPKRADVDEYEIHDDGGMIYNPISRTLSKKQKLGYGKMRKGTLELGGNKLTYEIPTGVKAYEAIPVKYELSLASGQEMPVHVEATAFEEKDVSKGEWYDLTLPGNPDLEWEYLGYVAGFETGERHVLSANYTDTSAQKYPSYETTELRKSGVLEAADYHWFRFRYKNVGDTILDPEGAGGMQFEPILYQYNSDGSMRKIGVPYNKYYRITEYVYPGESKEMWIAFGPHVDTPNMGWGLTEGEYRLQLKAVFRNDRANPEAYQVTQYGGYDMCSSTFDFKVESAAREVEPNDVKKGEHSVGGQNKWLHTFEEFMTSYDSWQRGSGKVKGTLYLQVAPFSEQVVIKLITNEPLGIASVALPVEVSSEDISLKLNTTNPYWSELEDGTRYPIIFSQSQADMRGNIQLSPYPEEQIVEDLIDMKECGVNMLSTTQMPWLYDVNGVYVSNSGQSINPQGDAYKFTLDAMRALDIELEGIGNYPFGRTTVGTVARWAGGVKYTISNAYPNWGCEASPSDENLANAVAIQSDYQFNRWGDNYFTTGTGVVPVTFEDTRGWMRVDMNTRFPIGEEGKKEFQKWAIDYYGSMKKLNAAWDSEYARILDVDPEAGQGKAGNGYIFTYDNPANDFYNWSSAVTALDVWRTMERLNNYVDFLADYRTNVPDAVVGIRTEGANWLVSGIPSDTKNSHYRHVYYSQRMNGMIAEIVQTSGIVVSHSDYQTLPYTPDEVRALTRASVKQGIIPMHIPQFCNMRDVAINRMYGNYEFGDVYNLKNKRRGAFIHTLSALYPWFAATYEEGGVPGILWQDYECDGYATETQKKEMKFFVQKLEETLSTPEGQKWRTDFEKKNEAYKTNSKSMFSYDIKYIEFVIEKVRKKFEN